MRIPSRACIRNGDSLERVTYGSILASVFQQRQPGSLLDLRGQRKVLKFVPLILFVVTTNAISQALLKQGMVTIGQFEVNSNTALATGLRIATDPWVIGGLLVMAISMAAHLYVLSRVPLTFAFPFIALSYVVVLAIGYFIFHESLNFYHFAGTAFIMLGITFIGFAGEYSASTPKAVPLSAQENSSDA